MYIKLDHLKKTYVSAVKDKDGKRPEITAVNDISLVIPENKIFGIIGKSGAGKSSLVRQISLLEKPDEGAVYYDERRVDNLSKKDLIACRRKIGMIFQNFNLFSSRTAGKNVAYPLEIAGVPKAQIAKRVSEMLALVGLSDKENAPISTLSGGQKQRVAIARALSTQPDILFCDEATSALDPNTTRSILSLIKEIQKKMNLTVVMITHQMEVVRDACEEVAVIENGKVVELGPVKEIFSNPKTQVTRDFIKNTSKESADLEGKENEFVKWTEKKGSYLLHFIGSATEEPILSKLSKKFDIEFNILASGITHLPDEDIGYMEVDFIGDDDVLQKAISWLLENNVKIQKI